MKKVTFLCSFLCFGLIALTQNWTSVYDKSLTSTPSFSVIINDSVLFVGVQNICASGVEHAFESVDNLWYISSNANTSFVDDSSVYIVKHLIKDILNHNKIYFFKINSKGELVDTLIYPPQNQHSQNLLLHDPNTAFIDRKGIIVTAGRNYEGKNYCLKIDHYGNSYWYKSLNINSNIIDNVVVNDSIYYFLADGGIYKSDSSALLIDSLLLSDIGDGFMDKDTSYVLGNNKILKISPSLDILDTIGLLHIEGNPKKVKRKNGIFYVMSKSADTTLIVEIANDGTIIQNHKIKTGKNNPHSFEIVDNRMYITVQSPLNQAGVISMEKESSSELKFADISITDVVLDSVTVLPGSDLVPDLYNVYGNLTFSNLSDQMIESFFLRLYTDITGNVCFEGTGYYGKYSKYDTLEIYASQNKQLPMELFFLDAPTTNNTIQLCFECLAPNGMLESDYDNNKVCETYVFTDIYEHTFESNFSVYPNPVKENLHLDLTNIAVHINTIQIFTNSGELITFISDIDRWMNLDVSNYPDGLYIIKIKTQNDVFTSKFIKL